MSELQEQARALGEPTRYRIFRYIAESAEPVGVAELTARHGLNHNAIRKHLAKLVAAGLVTEETAAPSGPGRPPLQYRVHPAADSRWGPSGPYERLSRMLTDIITTGRSPHEVGWDEGLRRTIDATDVSSLAAALEHAIARDGFEPEVRVRGNRVDVILHRCPFERIALTSPQTVCSLHLGMAEGMTSHVEGTEVDELVAQDPRRAGCRLTLHVRE